ncbi:MAG: DUF4255 domain-containing protein [Okeania sp. SIO3H1]|uniref:DUF4255 domain-containing protein n=1 Tax=Okeania sp. SIO1I7 TaxID=2607772 RepID=UPI0013C8C10B|nr:DUF4255 domain-containing protein [Okeania sp. SIO1I7]NEN91460.1 DUF4255 domain-containing protein [Okeania sp. SIO3H1]NET28624.1 DUF4255 domain-containing protein [Okeania sp. SIO1I7]
MIDYVMSFLQEKLNSYIIVKIGDQLSFSNNKAVVFIQNQNLKDVQLQENTITTLLINLEEEYTFRSGAAYERMPNGSRVDQKNPNIYLNLYVLFVPYFNDYNHSLKFLSLIIKFFQSHRLFDRHNSPELDSEIEKLTMELVNLPFTEQRDVWTGLGLPYRPSVIYKVRMVVFTDTDTVESIPDVTTKIVVPTNM